MELFSLQFLLFIFLLSLYFYSSKTKPISTGFKAYPLLGSIPEFLKNRHRFLDWTTDVLSRCPTNTSTIRRPGGIHGVITANPLNVEHMLKTNFENYPKGPQFISILEDFLGRGIFNSDADLWKVQRKTASYEFNTKSLRNFVFESVTVETQTRLVPILKKAAETGRVLDVQDILERFAFDNVCKLAFNVDPACLGGDATAGGDFMRAFEDAATLSSGRFMYAFQSIWKMEKFFNMRKEKRLKKSIAIVHEFAEKIIQSRLEQKAENKDQDLLSRFVGNDDNSPEFLRDIVISFILAGRDTTSSALTCISETMRLYPPVPVDTKYCLNDDVLPDGTFVGKGWFMTYIPYSMGRIESIWGKDCLQFKPERWLENGVYRQGKPVSVPDISCWAENVSGQGHGLYSDEVDCSIGDGAVLR
ncbi:Cytochrome P450 94A1 [Vitis vinifera]|uniref:Cytochrome P450 94A1 n=1 Tax=Vitis vinifera TaxID=29760 RepID=A0A438BXY3_VITVI|nr:Cytochrome P450 94A1 [Vitis vinifera]